MASPASAGDAIVVSNHANGETVRQEVVLLQGTVTAADGSAVVVRNLDSRRTSRETTVHARNRRFKALVALVPGTNRLEIECGEDRAALRFLHRPPTTANLVRFSYIVGSDGDPTYQSERPDETQDFRGKIDTAAKLFQTFCAESLAAEGLGARTVRLELDGDGRVEVHVVRAPKTGAEYRAYIDDQDLWHELSDVVRGSLPAAPAKDVAIMAFTRFAPVSRRALAHTALGGGDFGLFGSAGMFSWPGRLDEVEAAFLDAHPVDDTITHDDSAGRGTYWALAATTLGAVFHETGHTFGLPHSSDPLDIMTRGFDRLNRAFTVVEPPKRGGSRETDFEDAEVARWGPISGPRLAFHPFLELDPPGGRAADGPTIQLDGAHGKIVVVAPNGLRAVGIDSHGSGGVTSRETIVLPAPGAKRAEYDVADLLRRAGGEPFGLVAFDARDLRAAAGPGELRDPAEFVRVWRFAPPRPWTDRKAMPAWSDADLRAIENSASKEPDPSESPFIDLVARHGPQPGRIAFAYSNVRLGDPVRLRLLVGSDDWIRVRIDGRTVLERFLMRRASPDADSELVDLDAGKHVVAVECGNGDGGWGFFLRFADPDGHPWLRGRSGLLAPATIR